MTTALIIDPGLVAAHGHNYGALLRIGAELSRLDVKHTCLASVQADAVVRKHAAPVLPKKGLWWRQQETRSEFLAHAEELARQLSLALGEQEDPADLLVFPCCDAVQVQALATILRRRMPVPAPHIVMWILLPEMLEEYAGAFASLKEAVSDERRIAVYCETTAMAETLGDLIGLQVEAVPSANIAGVNGKGRRRGGGNAAANVVSMGVGNTAKGYDLLPGAIERVLRSNDDVTFWIHGVVGNSDRAHNLPIFEALSNMGRRVVVSNAVLTPEEYLDHLMQADLLLLPYDEKVYGIRGSGVFNEAREIGIPVVATRGCGFAAPAFRQGWGVEIAERSSRGVADAILDGISRLPDLTARASAAAELAGDGVAMVLQKAVRAVDSEEEGGGTGASRGVGWTFPVAQPLAKPLFSRIALSNGAGVRGSLPFAVRKLLSRLPTRGPLSPLTDALIRTSPKPHHYSVLLHVDGAVTRWLEPRSLLIVEVLVEVLAGEIGIVWIDDSGQPLQESERYALATPGLQRVVVSIPVDRARCLVFRNAAAAPTAASFRVVRLVASSVPEETEPPQVRLLAAGDHA